MQASDILTRALRALRADRPGGLRSAWRRFGPALWMACLALGAGMAQAQGTQAGAPALNGIYRGDDGSVLYLQQRGNEVFAFAEHPGRRYALVARGSLADRRIKADWWDVPKGERKQSGRVEIQVMLGGQRLEVTGGDDFGSTTLESIRPEQVPWPNRRAAGFQSSGTGNLTGAYEGNDNSRWYIRAVSGATVGVVEAAAQPEERPAWVSVFVGKPQAPGQSNFSGVWVDVPKGLQNRQGNIGAALLGPGDAIWNRELAVEQTGVQRTSKIEPDYAVDLKAMGQRIEQVMGSSGAVGWAYAIASPAGVIAKGAGGLRQRKVDGSDLAFTTDTLAQAASVSKTVTAIALARALHGRGLGFDSPIRSHLPPCWKPGPGVASLTFGDLASHDTGFEDPGGSDYERVKRTIERGNVREPDGFRYRNVNYGVMRYLIPLVARKDKARGIFDKWDCKDSRGDEINEEISKLFAEILLFDTFPPSVEGGMAFVPKTGDFSRNYNWQDPQVKGSPPNPKSIEKAGAGYLAMSAESAVLMLRALDAGEIVPVSTARVMKQKRYGFDSWYDTKAGRAAWKNGGCPTSPEGTDCAAWAVVFPGGTYAYLVINSGRRAPTTADTANLGAILRSSYDAAFK